MGFFLFFYLKKKVDKVYCHLKPFDPRSYGKKTLVVCKQNLLRHFEALISLVGII